MKGQTDTMKSRPFMFDGHVFDKDSAKQKKASEPKPPELKYTDNDLQIEKEKAFAEGKKAGISEAQNGHTQEILKLVQKIDRNFPLLFAAEDDRNARYEVEAVHLTYRILEKLFPIYMENKGFDELKHSIKSAIDEQKNIPAVLLDINESHAQELESFLSASPTYVNKQIVVRANSALSRMECDLSWPDGGAILNRNKIAHKIMTILQESLAERNISVHDSGNDPKIDAQDPNNSGEF